MRTKAKACSTEAGKNASPNSAEKNISIALAECSPAAEATCTPALPSSDKPHAKRKLEKEKQNLQEGKKNQPKPLSAGAWQKREGLGKTNPAPPQTMQGHVPPPQAVEQGSLRPTQHSRAGRYLHPTAQQSKHFPLKSA